jgi:hypothetical protein
MNLRSLDLNVSVSADALSSTYRSAAAAWPTPPSRPGSRARGAERASLRQQGQHKRRFHQGEALADALARPTTEREVRVVGPPGRALEDRDLEARPSQRYGRGQPADASSSDHHLRRILHIRTSSTRLKP